MTVNLNYNKIKNPVNKTIKIKITQKALTKRPENRKKQGFSVITVTNNGIFIDNIFENYNRQVFENKELIIILNKNSLDIKKYRSKATSYSNVRVFKIDEKMSLGYCLNFAASISKYDLIAKFDDDDYYGPKYLSSSFEVFQKTGADVIGKASHLVYFQQSELLAIRDPNRENRYVNFVNGSTLMFNKKIFDEVTFANISIGEDTLFCRSCIKKGIKIFSSDIYHHVYIRRKSKSSHTWKVSDKFLLERFCKPIMRTKDYISYADKIKALPI